MKIIEIKESELKSITLFLIDKKIIFHPKISPNGIPDFTEYEGKKFILILDRNLLVRILRLVNHGELKDQFSLKVVSSLLLWAEFNNISITAGLALTEYSHYHKGNKEASSENNVFLEIFKQYDPQHWLDLALGRRQKIPPIELKNNTNYNFFIEGDHFKMHYLEMLKISQLYFDNSITTENKFKNLYQWIYDNILICKYTTFFAALVFGEKSKIFKNQKQNFEEVNKKCLNQAWDLTYLSFWSTQYYYEKESKDIFLFATHDKEMKELFTLTHQESFDIYREIFGNKIGNGIINSLEEIYIHREKPKINSLKLDEMIKEEKQNLKQILIN